MRGENQSTRGKTSQGREENQQTQPTYDAESRNRTRATLVEGKCSRHHTALLNLFKPNPNCNCNPNSLLS